MRVGSCWRPWGEVNVTIATVYGVHQALGSGEPLLCTISLTLQQSIAVVTSRTFILQMRKWRPKELAQGHTSKVPQPQNDCVASNLWTRSDNNTVALHTPVG